MSCSRPVLVIVAIFLAGVLLFLAPAARAQTCWNGNSGMANGTGACINAHGVQQQVNNNSGANLCVPIGLAGEWSSFRAAPPSGVSVTSCAAPCWVPEIGQWVAHGWQTWRFSASGANNCGAQCDYCMMYQTQYYCDNGVMQGWWGWYDSCTDYCITGIACY